MKHVKFHKINQFRQVYNTLVKQWQFVGIDETTQQPIYDINIPLPKVDVTGTVKTHGTNAGITYIPKEDTIYANSRNSVITTQQDNAGFAFYVESNKDYFRNYIKGIYDHIEDIKHKIVSITLFGEWCGKGIQKGVALSELDKRFILFAIKFELEDETENITLPISYFGYELTENPDINFYCIDKFKTYSLTLDLTNPKEAVTIMENQCLEVENCCPVGNRFGIKGVGEGIVYSCILNDNIHIWKVKGQKHSKSGHKSKTSVSVEPEKLNTINEFINYAVSESRLEQSLEYVFSQGDETFSIQKVGEVIKWVYNDILAEEMDVLKHNNLEPKDVSKGISIVVRNWFLNKLKEF